MIFRMLLYFRFKNLKYAQNFQFIYSKWGKLSWKFYFDRFIFFHIKILQHISLSARAASFQVADDIIPSAIGPYQWKAWKLKAEKPKPLVQEQNGELGSSKAVHHIKGSFSQHITTQCTVQLLHILYNPIQNSNSTLMAHSYADCILQ